jgi:hypothetical protein
MKAHCNCQRSSRHLGATILLEDSDLVTLDQWARGRHNPVLHVLQGIHGGRVITGLADEGG